MKAKGRCYALAMPERTYDAVALILFATVGDAKAAKRVLPGFTNVAKNLLELRFFKAEKASAMELLAKFAVHGTDVDKLLPSEPLVFQGPDFDLDFTKALQKEPTPEQAGMTNRERFADEYGKALVKCIQKNPDEYMYGVDRVPEMVVKFVPSLARGEASLGPASKAAARACGIKSTLGAIKSFLNS